MLIRSMNKKIITGKLLGLDHVVMKYNRLTFGEQRQIYEHGLMQGKSNHIYGIGWNEASMGERENVNKNNMYGDYV